MVSPVLVFVGSTQMCFFFFTGRYIHYIASKCLFSLGNNKDDLIFYFHFDYLSFCLYCLGKSPNLQVGLLYEPSVWI